MTCGLDLSQRFHDSAATRVSRRERQAQKGKPKYFLTTSSVLKNEGKQSAGAGSVCLHIGHNE